MGKQPVAEDHVGVFIDEVKRIHEEGDATEHSYRPALKKLLESIRNDRVALNEPKASACGAPDFRISTKKLKLPICHLEAKDVNRDIRNFKGAEKDQFNRYKEALPNLIYTNCCEWDFYRDGKRRLSVRIADFAMGIQPKSTQYKKLYDALLEAFVEKPLAITSPKDLADRMAGMAKLAREVLLQALTEDEKRKTNLIAQFRGLKKMLMHDLTIEQFADIYAQTVAYGMFAARLHDPTLKTFSRKKALDLLPKTNPFLRKLFSFIAATDLDKRIKSVIDDLADIFRVCDVRQLLSSYGEDKGDPFIHFYEDFLKAYNPKEKEIRGVFYTPEPVVEFIVRSVDEILQSEFGLKEGLADTEKTQFKFDTGLRVGKKQKAVYETGEFHRVQILDPAAGTGTFLAEAVKQISAKVQKTNPGAWHSYVEENLIPRLHGFELLMAPYALCHMKLDLLLHESGFRPNQDPERLSVYLTNSLEGPGSGELDLLAFFDEWLAEEARGANEIKRKLPIMCIIGNPPYRGESKNKDPWIMDLTEAYKKEPNSAEPLDEVTKWINNDYLKFIRAAEHMISRTGEGVLGFVTDHSYLDGATFRGMRWHLMSSFDKIYVLDLHGNAKRLEIPPSGQRNENVFDIQQGVAIIVAIKKKHEAGASKSPARVFHADLWGSRKAKYTALKKLSTQGIWDELFPNQSGFFFVPRSQDELKSYNNGFPLTNLFFLYSTAIVTARDHFCISSNKSDIVNRLKDLRSDDDIETLRQKYSLGNDVRDWSVAGARKDVLEGEGKLSKIAYRPFDNRWTFYTGNSKGFHCMPRGSVMRHLINNDSLSLIVCRQQKGMLPFQHALVHCGIAESSLVSDKTSENGSSFPLMLSFSKEEISVSVDYLSGNITLAEAKGIVKKSTLQLLLRCKENWPEIEGGVFPNLDCAIVNEIASKIETDFVPLEDNKAEGNFSPLDILDYVYGVLHDPQYRTKYRDFLKSDFPRIPYPENSEAFWRFVEIGNNLRRLHLMEDNVIGETPYSFVDIRVNNTGSDEVKKPQHDGAHVWINDDKRFENVPKEAWEFYIGGYQPAQKWLKDRKGRDLSSDDVFHYQKIIKILCETYRIMESY